MVLKKEKERMLEFILEKLTKSEKYDWVKDPKYPVITLKENYGSERKFAVIMQAGDMTCDEFKLYEMKAIAKGYQGVAQILFKDGKIGMVRLGYSANTRRNKSLKNYSKDCLDRMIHLRSLEKRELERTGKYLLYYQPESERLRESIRLFEASDVELDYSHLDRYDSGFGFAKNHVSDDYVITKELESMLITSSGTNARLALLRNSNAALILPE